MSNKTTLLTARVGWSKDMKAKMKYNLVERYEKANPDCMDKDLKEFLLSIEGREVELTFTDGDAFEANDNSFWLPNELWDAI